MTKKELIKAVSAKSDYAQKDVVVALDALLDVIAETLAKGEDVNISGFGKFTVADKAATTARNPKTGESINVPAKRVAKFRPSSVLKKTVANA